MYIYTALHQIFAPFFLHAPLYCLVENDAGFDGTQSVVMESRCPKTTRKEENNYIISVMVGR